MIFGNLKYNVKFLFQRNLAKIINFSTISNSQLKYFTGVMSKQTIINNSMSSQHYKMARVRDKSFSSKSEQLYYPLQMVILKSQFPLQHFSHFSQLNKYPFHSQLSNKVCNLNPTLAKKIRQTTYLPIQSQLIPTNKLEKVQGKVYSILSVQEKIQSPLTVSQFAKVPRNNFKQIVYEIKDNGLSQISISSEHKKKIIRGSTNHTREKEEKSYYFVNKQSARRLQPTQFRAQSVLVSANKQQKVGNPVTEKRSNLSLSHGIQPYKFKKELLQGDSNLQSNLKKKKQYKYNLFSMVDEVGNNGCSAGFAANEFCASRRAHTQWS